MGHGKLPSSCANNFESPLDRLLIKTVTNNQQAGQEKFHALGPIYYRESNGALLVYDVTNPDSLRKVRDWVKELNKMLGNDNIKLAIIGNKIDLLPVGEQKCPQNNPLIQEALQLTGENLNAKHYLTSAKLNQGIGELFTSLSKRMVEQARKQLEDRNSRMSTRSRILKSLAVSDGSEDDQHHYGGSRIGVNLESRAEVENKSCQCWK